MPKSFYRHGFIGVFGLGDDSHSVLAAKHALPLNCRCSSEPTARRMKYEGLYNDCDALQACFHFRTAYSVQAMTQYDAALSPIWVTFLVQAGYAGANYRHPVF